MIRGAVAVAGAVGCALGLVMCGGGGETVVPTTAVAAKPLAAAQCAGAAGDKSPQGICFETSSEDPDTTLVRVRAPVEDRCIRVTQDGGQLGYAAVHDAPKRQELEIAVHDGQAAFVLNVKASSLASDAGSSHIRGSVAIDFFELPCGALCDHQPGDDRLVLDRDGAHVGSMRSDAGTQCPFLSQMPSVWGQDAGPDASH